MHINSFKKVVTLIVSVLMIATAMLVPAPAATALSTSQMKDKISDYEDKAKEIANKIDSLDDDLANAQALAEAIDEKIDNLESQISLVNNQISDLNAQVKEAEEKVAAKEADIEKAKETLKQRLRAIYIAGSSSELEVLMSASDFSDFLAKSELISGVTKHDTELMKKLNDELVEINKLKAEIEESQKDAKALKSTLVSKQNELDKEYAAAQSAYNNAAAQQNSLESEAEEVAKAKAAMESEWKAAIAAESDTSRVLSSMNFAWPFQSSYYISCAYGQQSYRFHTGVDITCSGALGKPIYAIADGKVIRASYSSVSYGNCLIIDHGQLSGNQYSSLYAHCQTLLVSYGQEVKKGQLIAYCGSTGNSTGPHLHFEIRVNGSHTNPLNFYSNY